MKDKSNHTILKAFFYTLIIILVSLFGFGTILGGILNYSSVQGSYHLPTHALLIGLIFTVVICTIVIVGKIEEK